MTTAKTPKSLPFFPLPDPPEIQDEKMTAARHLTLPGNAHYLAQHLGSPETTVMDAEHYITSVPPAELPDMTGVPYPDLLVALNADPATCRARNGYVISEQGKPPDFVLEIASPSTGRRDTVDKRITYADLRIQNTGGSMKPASFTAPGWPATGWWAGDTSPSRLKNCPTAACGGTAPS